jgi:DNA-binding GntR family transcriptional regulator
VPRATDVVYARLTQSIISLELEPGRLINERELAERLGVTRLTLIPALHRLCETGLISVLPRRGVQVEPIHVTDVQQVFDARLTLETGAVEMAARRASPEQVRQIRQLAVEIDGVVAASPDYRVFLEHDRHLHLAVAELCRNRFLMASMERVWNVNLRLWHLFFRERGGSGPYYLGHEEVIDAVAAADPDRARAAMAHHIVRSKELLQSGLWGE